MTIGKGFLTPFFHTWSIHAEKTVSKEYRGTPKPTATSLKCETTEPLGNSNFYAPKHRKRPKELLILVYQPTRKKFREFLVNLQSRPLLLNFIMIYEQYILKYSRGKRAAGVLWKQDLQDCNVYELIL